MNNQKIYGFDADGVIINVPKRYIEQSENFNENALENRKLMLAFFKTPIWKTLTLSFLPIEDIYILRDIIEHGDEVHIISRRAQETDLKILVKRFKKDNLKIPVENIHLRKFDVPDEDFVEIAEFKFDKIVAQGIDIFWDDNARIIESINDNYKPRYEPPGRIFISWEDVRGW